MRRCSVLTLLGELLKRGSNRHPRDFSRGEKSLPAPGIPLLALRVSQHIWAFDFYEPLPDLPASFVFDLMDDAYAIFPALRMERMHARLVGVRGESAVDALLDMGWLDLIRVTSRQQARYASAKFNMALNCLCPGLIGFERLPPTSYVVRRMIER